MAAQETPPLHLPSLSIKGFRGIRDLAISRLGRVTLLAGKNGVGKTTVLDAVRVYAARGHPDTLSRVLESHAEVTTLTESGGQERVGPHLETIFYGRDTSNGAFFSIGSNINEDQLVVEAIDLDKDTHWGPWHPDDFNGAPVQGIEIRFIDGRWTIPWYFSPYALSTKIARDRRVYQNVKPGLGKNELLQRIPCESVGPETLSNDKIVEVWDRIDLTDDEPKGLNAVQFMLDRHIERIGARGDASSGKRMLVKVRGQSFPVPIESFGDGALRLFGFALALINSKDGFLLIDEAENGIHHSVQRDLWRMILKTAAENNVQVLATTHSYDCIRGFAQAMAEDENADGALVRIERRDERLRAVEYSENNIKVIANQPVGTEVR